MGRMTGEPLLDGTGIGILEPMADPPAADRLATLLADAAQGRFPPADLDVEVIEAPRGAVDAPERPKTG
jgi:hypothetical protein